MSIWMIFLVQTILESGKKTQVQLVSMLKDAGMELHKWSASNPYYYQTRCVKLRTSLILLPTVTKTPGLLWKHILIPLLSKISPMTSNCDNS
ncbi:hypothetical protein TNCV_1414821 [Trichonephila clavipes]|nr:hypothetical protein TNCV_1414821 [Trichonephila clavipes]